MIWMKIVAITTFYCLGAATSSPVPDELLQAIDASSLFTLQDSADPTLVWAQYERFLLSKSRVTPLLLYLTSATTCDRENDEAESREDDDSWEDEDEAVGAPTTAQELCVHHDEMVEAAVKLVAETLSTQLTVIRMDVHVWPEVLPYHLVSSTPSLLWMPGRVSGHFQRYPHVETNFLDLSANGSLFSGQRDDVNAEEPNRNAAVAKEITAFVRLCQEKSGYLIRNARGRLSPAVPLNPVDDAYFGLEMIPIVAVVAFVAFVVLENRELVLGVVQTRFFWFMLCSGVIFVALSGLFHSIIHQRAWYYFGRAHGFVFVYPSSRRQFVLEGLVNGTWSFWLSLGAMSLSDVLPTLRSRLAREDVIRWALMVMVTSYMVLYFTFLIKYRWLA